MRWVDKCKGGDSDSGNGGTWVFACFGTEPFVPCVWNCANKNSMVYRTRHLTRWTDCTHRQQLYSKCHSPSDYCQHYSFD